MRHLFSILALIIPSAALAQLNPITEPASGGSPYTWFLDNTASDGRNLDSASNDSGESVVVWRQTTGSTQVPVVGELFTVYAQLVNPNGVDRGPVVQVATNQLDSDLTRLGFTPGLRFSACTGPLIPNTGPSTIGSRVRCDIADDGTIVVAWDYINTTAPTGPTICIRAVAMDFRSGNATAPLDVGCIAATSTLDVDVAVGPVASFALAGSFPAPMLASFVYSADFAPGAGQIDIRSRIEVITVPITPGPSPSFGTESAPTVVATLPSNCYTNHWGWTYLPSIDIDALGRGVVTYCQKTGCTGSPCNQVLVRMRRFLHATAPTWTNLFANSTTTTPTQDLVIDGQGWVAAPSAAPVVDLARDGRAVVRWYRQVSTGLATLTPGPGNSLRVQQNVTVTSAMTGGGGLADAAVSAHGPIALAVSYVPSGLSNVSRVRLVRLDFSTLQQIGTVASSLGDAGGAWDHPSPSTVALGSLGADQVSIDASATGGVEVTMLRSAFEVARTHFDFNAVQVNSSAGGTTLTVNIDVPGAPGLNYLLIFSLADYTYLAGEDTFPDGRHSGTNVVGDTLSALVFDPLVNPWFASFFSTLGAAGTATTTFGPWPVSLLPSFFATVVTRNAVITTSNDFITFSTPELVTP